MSMNVSKYTYKSLEGEDIDWEYKKKYRDNTPQINPEAYFSDYNRV